MENEAKYQGKPNAIREKSFAFALRIVKLVRYLQEEKHEYVLSKQLLRCGTAVGALVREAEHAESKAARPLFELRWDNNSNESSTTDFVALS